MEHLNRYGIATADSIQRAVRGVTSAKHARRVLRELESERSVRRFPLYRNRLCWMPSRMRLTENQKIHKYAMLAFCCQSEDHRVRLTRADYKQHFPGLLESRSSDNYFIELTQTPQLGFLRIDSRSTGRWDRIIAKARQDAFRHLAKPEFRPYIDQGSFVVHIVTPLHFKALRIREQLDSVRVNVPVPIAVSSIPELINLIAPLPV